jgi:hypothetical protein
MPAAHRFAEARGRARGALPRAALKYERAESSPLTTITDTNARLIEFSGYPDSIDLSAQAFGAIFVLMDHERRTITEYHVPAGQAHVTYFRAFRVEVRNAVAGSNAIVMAVGKWAEEYEAE